MGSLKTFEIKVLWEVERVWRLKAPDADKAQTVFLNFWNVGNADEIEQTPEYIGPYRASLEESIKVEEVTAPHPKQDLLDALRFFRCATDKLEQALKNFGSTFDL